MIKILVPTDFSDVAMYGAEVAMQIAEKISAEVYLLNVINPPPSTSFSAMGDVTAIHDQSADVYTIELTKTNKARLVDMQDKLQRNGVNIIPMITIGNLQDGMDNFISDYGIDMVVMGTTGENTFAEYFVGNNTEQIIKISKCPVISVKQHVPDFQIRNIVLASDLDPKSTDGINQVVKFAKIFNAVVHVLHIVTSSREDTDKAYSKLVDFAHMNGLQNYKLHSVYNEDEETGIKTFASEIRADIIIVLHRHRNFFTGLFDKSTSADVARDANQPVMTINLDKNK